MALRMVCIDDSGTVRLAADGPIMSGNFASASDHPLETLLGVAWARHRVLLDLDKADYIDSHAVGWLLNCHRAFAAGGGRLVLHSVQPKVRRILTTLRVDAVLPLAADEASAQSLLQKKEVA